MRFTWGYLKEVVLAKLDLDETEANEQGLLNRFQYYANEAMTQICSTVKPKHTFVVFNAEPKETGWVDEIHKMPSDFIAFGDDVNTIKTVDDYHNTWIEECSDEDFTYRGYNEVILHRPGRYEISYKARWFTFESLENSTVIDIPDDVFDCLPSYIASQCYKIDDEVKSSIFRNEYEMFLSRVDDTNYKRCETIKIGGDW